MVCRCTLEQVAELALDGKVVADLIVRRLLVDKVNDEKSVEAPPQS